MCIKRLKHSKSPIHFLNLTQTQAAVHLRSKHKRAPEPTGRLTCAGAASYRLKKRKTNVVLHTEMSTMLPLTDVKLTSKAKCRE